LYVFDVLFGCTNGEKLVIIIIRSLENIRKLINAIYAEKRYRSVLGLWGDNMITIKFTAPPIPSFTNFPLRQTQDEHGAWGNYSFVFDEYAPKCDYWVVYDILPVQETHWCNPKNLIFITGEPPHIGAYSGAFLKQFNHIITCHNDIKGPNVYHHQQSLPWFVNKGYKELSQMNPVAKTKILSLITTKRDNLRSRAAIRLKQHFGDRMDLFGIGFNTVRDKWDALAPYKYSIVMENGRYNDYFTEKLSDCYLAFTYPFYYGCPNIRTGGYFPEPSMTVIDINNIEETIDLIEKVIASDFYNERLPHVIKSRDRVLNQHNVFPMIINYIESHAERFGDVEDREPITITDKSRFVKDKAMFLKKLFTRMD
jgi:hypothetical protein